MKKLFLSFIISCLFMPACFGANYNTRTPLPGNTLANRKLQYDTIMPVYMATGTKLKNCETMSIINTKVTRQPYNLKMQGGQYTQGQWEELWTVNACGKTADVPIKFILDSTGATYMISPNNIVIR
ncbi:hypothetical protein IJ541_03455 [bacterium]|nr:hypothetical protein [bacterium]